MRMLALDCGRASDVSLPLINWRLRAINYLEQGENRSQKSSSKFEVYCDCFKFNIRFWFDIGRHEAKYISQDIFTRNFISMPSLRSLNLVLICSPYPILETLERLRNLPGHWSSSIKRIQSEARNIDPGPSKIPVVTGCSSRPCDLPIQRLNSGNPLRLKTLSIDCKNLTDSLDFEARSAEQEGSFTAIHLEYNDWRCTGFDLLSKIWRSFPLSPTLPPPDVDLFKEYSLHSHDGLACMDIAKLPKRGELIVFNPLTWKTFQLPSLLYSRTPVLLHILVDRNSNSYKVIAAGSSTVKDEHLSRKMEIFSSETSRWEEAPDIPGPPFGLNEHQAGVTINEILYMITFLEGDSRRGVVAYDLQNNKWLENKTCPISFSLFSNTLQLLESDGELVLFSEQEQDRSVYHCIDVLAEGIWQNVIRVRKPGGRGLQVYPEHVCVPFGAGKVCVFNALNRDGVVYDVKEGREVDVLEAPSLGSNGEKFFTLNPISFMVQPRFDIDPAPKVLIERLEPSNDVGKERSVGVVGEERSSSVGVGEAPSIGVGVGVGEEPLSGVAEKRPCGVGEKPLVDVGDEQPIDVGDEQPIDVGDEQPIDVSEDQPIDVSEDQPIDVCEEQPIDMDEEQPIDVSEEQPIDVGVGEERLIDGEERPFDMGEERPIDVSEEQPIDMGEKQPIGVGDKQPIDVSKEQPIDVCEEQPIDVGEDQPIDVCKEQPIDVSKEQPIDMGEEQSIDVGVGEEQWIGGEERPIDDKGQLIDVGEEQHIDVDDEQPSGVGVGEGEEQHIDIGVGEERLIGVGEMSDLLVK